eukprot:3206250-Alexandrium_andersonii.AAC.1
MCIRDSPLIVVAHTVKDIFRDELASELKSLVQKHCPSEEEYAPEWYEDGPDLSAEMATVADRLAEARLYKPNSHNLCRLSLVRDDPRNPADIIYFVCSSLDKKVSGRVLNLAKLARASLDYLDRA